METMAAAAQPRSIVLASLQAADDQPDVALRVTADADCDIACLVPNGTSVAVLQVEGDFARVRLQGQEASHFAKRWHLPGFAGLSPGLLFSRDFEIAKLEEMYPVTFRHPNKQAVFLHAGAHETIPQAPPIGYTRWSCEEMPEICPRSLVYCDAREGFFDYSSGPEKDEVHWYPNFAHRYLFTAWDSDLLAQDELQVLEMPALASVQMSINGDAEARKHAQTMDASGATPILLRSVPRRLVLDTQPCAARPSGLYGQAFARAKTEDCVAGTTPLCPATYSNLYCIEAPPGGKGKYILGEIRFILETAYAAFAAAACESHGLRCIIHAGYWGCGAYGGNTTLMAALQLLAARLAGVPHIVFHVAREGHEPLRKAESLLQRLAPPGATLDDVLDAVCKEGFRWGVSTGE